MQPCLGYGFQSFVVVQQLCVGRLRETGDVTLHATFAWFGASPRKRAAARPSTIVVPLKFRSLLPPGVTSRHQLVSGNRTVHVTSRGSRHMFFVGRPSATHFRGEGQPCQRTAPADFPCRAIRRDIQATDIRRKLRRRNRNSPISD